MATRAQIRRRIRLQRRELSPAERHRIAERIVHRITSLPIFARSRRIAIYLPNDGEVDLRPLLTHTRAAGKRWYLPVLGLPYENRLWFMPYTPGSALRSNRFGIPEPAMRRRERACRPWALDLILAPLVAFDAAGNRLGMGGGYYDRSLAFLHTRRRWRKPRVLGIAYGFQQVAKLPTACWDVPLDAVVTDLGVHQGLHPGSQADERLLWSRNFSGR